MAEERQNNSQAPDLSGTNGLLVTFPTTKSVQVAPDYGTTAGKVAQGNDSRFPTAGEDAALAGTFGTPGVGNEYVTNTDPRVAAVAEVKDQGILEGTNIKKLNFSTNLAVTVVGDQANITSTGGGTVSLEDEGSPVAGGPHTVMNFTGAGVTVTDAGGGEATISIPGGGGGGVTLEDEGSTVTGGPHTTINFVGADVSVADAGAGEATVTVTSSPLVTVQDEGSPITATPHTTLDFVGGGVTATNAGGGIATITIPTPSISVEDEGSPVTNTPHTTINFTGAGVTATDAGGGQVDVSIPGSSGVTVKDEGSTVTGGPHGTLNFVGGGVTATDAGGGQATITIPSPSLTIKDEGTNVTNTPHSILNFTGTGVKVTDAGGGQATINIPLSGFDAVVDVSGGGDYTTVQAAIDAGASSLFIRNGTYPYSADLLIDQADAPAITMIGESRDGVIFDFSAGAFSMRLTGLLRGTNPGPGTVTLSQDSTTISGIGTAFVANGIVAGDRLAVYQATDLSLHTAEVITTPVSATSLTSRQWRGRTTGTLNYVAFNPRKTVSVSNITFQNSTVSLVELAYCVNISFSNCLFKDGLQGILIEAPVQGLTINSCEFIACTDNFLRIDQYLNETLLQASSFSYLPSTATNGFAIYTSDAGATATNAIARVGSLSITDCRFTSLHKGIRLSGVRGCSVKGSKFSSVKSFVFEVTNAGATRASEAVVVSGNRFEYCGISTALLIDVASAGVNSNSMHVDNNGFFKCDGTARIVNGSFTNNSVEINTSIAAFGGFLLNLREVVGNTFETCGNTAESVVYSNNDRCIVANNRFVASRWRDVYFVTTSPSKCVVANNHSDLPTDGFITANSDYGIIANNTIRMNATGKTVISVVEGGSLVGRNVVSGNVIQLSGGASCKGISMAARNGQVKDNIIYAVAGAHTTGIEVTAGSTAKTWVEGNLISTGFTSQLTDAGTGTQLGSETVAGFLTA